MDEKDFIDIPIWDDKPVGESRRRKMNIFYLIDASGSMYGDKMESVNEVMPEVVDIVAKISDDNMDNAEICVSALVFNNGTKWMYSEALGANDFTWIKQKANGGTDLGEACLELERALHRQGPKAQLTSSTGHKNPAVILLSDGYPTDNFELGLQKLKSNNWFKSASKVAFQLGGDVETNIDTLVKFTGSKELVIKVTEKDALKEMLKVASAVVSQVGSQSASVKSNGEMPSEEEEIITTIDEATKNIQGAASGDDISSLPPGDIYD